MDIEEIRNLKVGQQIIIKNFYMRKLGDPGITNHAFTVTVLEREEKPIFVSPWMLPATGPAKKIVLEHYKNKYKMYLLVPEQPGKDNYIYFTDDEDIPGDNLPERDIELYK